MLQGNVGGVSRGTSESQYEKRKLKEIIKY